MGEPTPRDFADFLPRIRQPVFEPPLNMADFQPVQRPTMEQADKQLEHLADTKVLLSALNQTIQNAEKDRKQAEIDRGQQSAFNKRMTVVAVFLSFAAVVAPFLVYWLEHGWWWETFRP